MLPLGATATLITWHRIHCNLHRPFKFPVSTESSEVSAWSPAPLTKCEKGTEKSGGNIATLHKNFFSKDHSLAIQGGFRVVVLVRWLERPTVRNVLPRVCIRADNYALWDAMFSGPHTRLEPVVSHEAIGHWARKPPYKLPSGHRILVDSRRIKNTINALRGTPEEEAPAHLARC